MQPGYGECELLKIKYFFCNVFIEWLHARKKFLRITREIWGKKEENVPF